MHVRQVILALIFGIVLAFLYIVQPIPATGAENFERPAPTIPLRVAHASLQRTDTSAQHIHDIEKLFSQKFDVITGTEAGKFAGNTNQELRRASREHGYRLQALDRYDTWVAVRKAVMKPGSWRAGVRFAFNGVRNKWSTKGVVWAKFYRPGAGWISVGATHNVTKWAAGPARKFQLDQLYAIVMGTWSRIHGGESRLAFLNGDFNQSDKIADVFFGEERTTCWDELRKWPNTGHGNIDATSSYDRDVRVSCAGASAMDDRRFFLHTDHFLVTSTYKIRKLS